MKQLILISAGALILASGFIFKHEQTSRQTVLYETKWSLKKMHTAAGMEDVFTKAFIKFNREKQSAGGNGSCNHFGSTTRMDGHTISFSQIFSTKMYCEGVQETENRFFHLLGQASRFEVKGNQLFLYKGKQLLLEFLVSRE